MKRIAVFTVITILFTGLVAIVGEALPQGEKEGYFLRVTGEVRVERNEETTVAYTRMDILGGDLIITGADGEAALRLNGGHVITIRENTQFVVNETGPEKDSPNSCMVYYGLVYVRSAPGKRVRTSLMIQTPTAVAGVRGTEFGLAVAPDGSARFAVEGGVIDVATDEGAKTAEVTMMQELTIEAEDNAQLQPVPYSPGQRSLEDWRAERMNRILSNPIPVAKRLSANMSVGIKRGERLLRESNTLADEIIKLSNEAIAYRKRGQSDLSNYRKIRIKALMRQLMPMVRRLVRLDNRIQSKGKQLGAILRAATAEGSPTPPGQVKIIEEHMGKILGLKESAQRLHRGRARFMRVKVPILRKAIAQVL